MQRQLTAVISSLVLLATACSNGSSPAVAQLLPDAAITRTNALAAASAVYRSGHELVRVARIAGTFFQVAPPAPTGGSGSPAILAQQVTGPEGGSAILSWDDRDGDRRYSTGDSFAIACTDYTDQGLGLTGSIQFDQVDIEGDVTAGLTWILTARLHLIGLVATNPNTQASVTLDLDVPFAREQRATVRLLSLLPDRELKVGPRTLQLGTVLGRNDYQIDFRMGLLAEGAVMDPTLGGTLTFHTKALLTGVQVLPDPAEGLLEIHGGNRSKLVVAPIDFFNCELRVDENGDGVTDITIPAEWSTLQ